MALKGLVCFVAGGASGLGLASARRLVREGAKVLIADLPSSRGEEVATEIGNDCIFAATDVSRSPSPPPSVEWRLLKGWDEFTFTHKPLWLIVVEVDIIPSHNIIVKCAGYKPGISSQNQITEKGLEPSG